MGNIKIILILILIHLPAFLQAQSLVQPDIITIEDGLSQGYVSCIHQDREGFIWFGTKNGLNRYDGKSFKVFTTDYTNPYAISNEWVIDIYEEGDYLFLVTNESTINIFHKISSRFYKVNLPKALLSSQKNWSVSTIFKDVLGQYWLIDRFNKQAWKMTLPKGFWEALATNQAVLQKIDFLAIPQNDMLDVWLSPDSTHLLTSQKDGTFLKTNVQSLVSQKIDLNDQGEKNKVAYNLRIGQDTFINIMLTSQSHLITNPKIKTIQNDLLVDLGEIRGSNIHYLDHLNDKNWFILNAYNEKSSFYFEKSKLNYQALQLKNANYKLNTKGFNFFSNLTDRSGNIWLGTDGLGIRKITHRKKNIQTLFEGNSIYRKPYIFDDGTSLVFAPGGVGTFNIKEESTIMEELGLKSFFQSASDFVIWDGFNNIKWFYWHGNEASDFTNKVFPISSGEKINPQNFLKIEHRVSTYFKDEKSELDCFAGYSLLTFYNHKTGQTKKLSLKDLFKNTITDIYSITITQNGHWWVGTSSGLVEMIPNSPIQKDSFPSFSLKWHKVDQSLLSEDHINGLLNNDVATLLTDPKDADILWIGTKGGGLHRLDTRTMSFEHLTTKNGLPNDVIYGVLNDDNDNLWMSSNKGLIQYHPESGKINNYTKADGLQGDEFNTWAYGKTSKGELVFGGVNGLNIFDPAIFVDNKNTPTVKLTNLDVNNQTIEVNDSTGILKRSITFTESLSLPYHNNSFTLHFAALEFTAPEKNRFRYYLEGSEEPWQHESARNDAQYLSLAPGNYIFKIKAANGDGIWSDEITELAITILPPWYRSNLAYLIYLSLIGLGIWQFTRFQKRRYQLQYEVEAKEKEKEQLQELDQAKSRLYTNITHEFRTPLTVISGIANQVKDENTKKLIQRNSHQLLNLVNQMLDLRKLESGTVKIQYQQGDIVQFLRYLTESLKSYAEETKGLTIHFISDEESLMMDFDAEKITRIHSNLLSNAIKFTPKGGNIYIQVALDNQQLPASLSLTVRDTGVGISEDKLPNIFERFYQVDDSSTRKGEGTGIGLTLVSELIQAMQGEIKVKSIIGKGSTFTIHLPISNEAIIADQSTWKKEAPSEMIATAIPTDLNFAKTENQGDEKPTVLIVEDNPDVIHYLITCLKESYNIVIAMNGEEGIEKALEEIPDLIVSDVMMPIKDGFELCQTLKTDERTSHIPIVLLTAKADMEARLQGLERGADAYLSKPFHQDELLLILSNQLKLRKQLQARLAKVSGSLEALDTLLEEEKEAAQQHLQIEDAFLQKIRAIVEKDISDSDLSMPQLMRGLGMSRSQIYKKVKALTGISPTHYIRSIRLFHAKKLLKTTDLNVSEVAYEVGFSTPSYFSTAYLEEFGISPNETRK